MHMQASVAISSDLATKSESFLDYTVHFPKQEKKINTLMVKKVLVSLL